MAEYAWTVMATVKSRKDFPTGKLEAITGACILIAGKLDGRPLLLEHLCQHLGNRVQPTDILAMEKLVISVLDWNLSLPTSCDIQRKLLEPLLDENSQHLLASANARSLDCYSSGEIFARGVFWCAAASVIETLETYNRRDLKRKVTHVLTQHASFYNLTVSH